MAVMTGRCPGFPGTFSAPNGQGQISKASKVFNFPSLLELLHLPGVNELTRMLANISKQIGNINQITKWVNYKQLHLLHISLKQLAKDPNNNKLPYDWVKIWNKAGK